MYSYDAKFVVLFVDAGTSPMRGKEKEVDVFINQSLYD
jgi:hypothetical protein